MTALQTLAPARNRDFTTFMSAPHGCPNGRISQEPLVPPFTYSQGVANLHYSTATRFWIITPAG